MLLPQLVIDFIDKEGTVEGDESKVEGYVDVEFYWLVKQPNCCCLDKISSLAEVVWTSCI